MLLTFQVEIIFQISVPKEDEYSEAAQSYHTADNSGMVKLEVMTLIAFWYYHQQLTLIALWYHPLLDLLEKT